MGRTLRWINSIAAVSETAIQLGRCGWGAKRSFPRRRVNVVAQLKADRIGLWLIDFVELIRLLDELSGWIRCFWVVGFLLNPVGRAFPVDVTGGGQGRAL